jgi:hypothetical protein
MVRPPFGWVRLAGAACESMKEFCNNSGSAVNVYVGAAGKKKAVAFLKKSSAKNF